MSHDFQLPSASRYLVEDGIYDGDKANFVLPDGSMRRDVRHGEGRCVYSDKSVYEGLWDNGQMAGQGTYTWPDGTCYSGKWRKGKMDGPGTMIFKN